jgi:hypothetical protein
VLDWSHLQENHWFKVPWHYVKVSVCYECTYSYWTYLITETINSHWSVATFLWHFWTPVQKLIRSEFVQFLFVGHSNNPCTENYLKDSILNSVFPSSLAELLHTVNSVFVMCVAYVQAKGNHFQHHIQIWRVKNLTIIAMYWIKISSIFFKYAEKKTSTMI